MATSVYTYHDVRCLAVQKGNLIAHAGRVVAVGQVPAARVDS